MRNLIAERTDTPSPETPELVPSSSEIDEVDFIVKNYKAKTGQRNSKVGTPRVNKKSYVAKVDRKKGEGGGLLGSPKVKVKKCKQGQQQALTMITSHNSVLGGDCSESVTSITDESFESIDQ